MKSSRIRRFDRIVFFASLILFVLLWARFPSLFSSHLLSDWKTRELQTAQNETLLFQEIKDTSSVFNYRGGPERADLDPEPLPRGSWRRSWAQGFNVGIHGASKASPAVDETGIYVGDDQGWFHAFDWQGRRLWRFHIQDSDRGIHATASLSKEAVFIGGYNGRFYALDKKTGRPLWIRPLGEAIGASSLLHEGDLYLSVEMVKQRNGFLARLDARTGQVKWSTDWLGEQIHSSPTLHLASRTVVAGANNSMFYGFDSQTGKLKWSKKLDGEIKGTAALVEEVLYVADWGSKLRALHVETGDELWQTPLSNRSQSSFSPLPEKGLGLIGDANGLFWAIELSTGRVIWKKEFPRFNYMASPAIRREASGEWVWFSACGPEQVCRGRLRDGSVLETWNLGGRLTSIPVFWKNKLVLALNSPGRLEVLELGPEKGSVTTPLTQELRTSPRPDPDCPPDQVITTPGRCGSLNAQMLRGAQIVSEDWNGFRGTNLDFSYSSWIASQLNQAQFVAGQFHKAHLFQVRAVNSDWRGGRADALQLDSSQLRGSRWWGLQSRGFVVKHSDMREASFRDSVLLGATFSNSDLRGADFNGAVLWGAKYSGNQTDSSRQNSTDSTGPNE